MFCFPSVLKTEPLVRKRSRSQAVSGREKEPRTRSQTRTDPAPVHVEHVAPDTWLVHHFVLTGGDGARYYGHCLRFSARDLQVTRDSSKVTGQHSPLREFLQQHWAHSDSPALTVPLDSAVCVLTTQPWYDTVRTWLVHVWRDSVKAQRPIEPRLTQLFQEAVVPHSTAYAVKVQLDCAVWPYVTGGHVLSLPHPSQPELHRLELRFMKRLGDQFPLLDFSLAPLRNLSAEIIATVLAALLLERKVILTSNYGAVPIVHACEAFTQLMWPLQWSHVYIPHLPLELLELVQAPTPYFLGVLRSLLPEDLTTLNLGTTLVTDAVLVVDLDRNLVFGPHSIGLSASGTLPLSSSSPQLNVHEAREDFEDIDLTASAPSVTSVNNTNVNNASLHSSGPLKRTASEAVAVPQLPRIMHARLCARLESALCSALLEAGYAYKVTDVQHGDEMTQRVQSAVYMMYLDLLADCDLTHVNYFLDTLDSAESRSFYEQFFETQAFQRVIEERLVEGSGAHFLFTCLEHQASEVRQLVLEAFELPAQYLEIDDPLEPTCEPLPLEHQRNPVLNFHNDQFRAARYDHVLAEVNRLIFTDPESTDLYVLRIHYHMQHEKYDKALSDLTSLSELDSEHVLFNSMQLFRELFAKLSEDQLAKLRTLSSTRVKKLSELAQQYCEENSVGTGLGPADSKPRDSDWESISTDSSEQNTPQMTIGDWAHLDNIPGPESDPTNIDRERQTMSKYQLIRYMSRVKLVDDPLTASRLFTILSQGMKRTSVKLKTVKQFVAQVQENQRLNKMSWAQTVGAASETEGADELEGEQSEIVLLHGPVNLLAEGSELGPVALSSAHSTRGVLFLTNKRLFFVAAKSKSNKPRVIDMRIRSISKIEKFDQRLSALWPALPCIRVHKSTAHTHTVLTFHISTRRSFWYDCLNEIFAAFKVSRDLEDDVFLLKAITTVILSSALQRPAHKTAQSKEVDHLLFTFKDFTKSNFYQIGRILASEGMLNTAYKWEEAAHPKRESVAVASDVLATALRCFCNASDLFKLRASREFNDFVIATAELQVISLNNLSQKEKACLFVNIYNAIVIHALVLAGFPQSLLEWRYFARHACFNVGGFPFTLDAIHRILRGRQALSGRETGDKKFKKNDPRSEHTLAHSDPRLHFVLALHNKSCPRVQILHPQTLEQQLRHATALYCEEHVVISTESHEITLPKLFYWYGNDFGDNVLQWVAQHLSAEKSKQLTRIIESGKYSVTFDYRWDPLVSSPLIM